MSETHPNQTEEHQKSKEQQPRDPNYNFDSIYDVVGGFGKFQKIYVGLMLLSGIVAGMQMYLTGLAFPSPQHRCKIDGVEGFEDKEFEYESDSQSAAQLSLFAPKINGTNRFSSCCVFRNSTPDNSEWRSCKGDHLFDRSEFQSSANEDWNLVCGETRKIATASTVYFLGVMFGGVIMGQVSDYIGRLKTFAICNLLTLVFGVASAFAPNFWVFVVFRFLVGFFVLAAFLTAFVLEVELMGPRWRMMIGLVVQVTFAIGTMILAGLYYAIRDWRCLQWIASLPAALFLPYLFIIPESPRWLYINKKWKELEKVLRKIAKINGKDYPEDFVRLFIEESEKESAASWMEPVRDSSGTKVEVHRQQNANVLSLFNPRRPRVLGRTLNICWNWLVNSMLYYGLTIASENLGDDPFFNLFISGAVELPAYLLTFFAILYLGRRILLAGFLIFGGAMCLVSVAIPPSHVVVVVLAMIGKLCVSASFALIYVYSAELFPTVVRNSGVGVGSMSARLGGMLAPQIAAMASISDANEAACDSSSNRNGATQGGGGGGVLWPLIVFGAAAISAGLLALLLPETRGRPAPENLEDAENFGKIGGGGGGDCCCGAKGSEIEKKT